jgi:hypothetical protein
VINPDKNGLLWIRDLTGGLNDTDAPQDVADNQCQIAQNVEWNTTRFAQRRQGGSNGINVTEPWVANATLQSLMRHTPTADESAAELWGVDNDGTPVMGRMAGSNQFVAVTVGDAWASGDTEYINGVSLNGKFFIAGNTAVDRLHVWTGATFRRVGLATPAAATVANTGAGTYAAVQRYYKVQWQNATVTPNVLSELSPAVSFTPSGAGTAARVTRPALPSESETNWILWASPDGINYYIINSAAFGTTTIDDNAAPSSYATAIPALSGFPSSADYYTPPHSPKYLLADEDRLLLLSSWETASMASAVMWTPVLGTTPTNFNIADDERVPSDNRLDLDRGDGGGITGGAVMAGAIYIFKYAHIYRLERTGDDDLPYAPKAITKALGAVSHKSIVVGEDEAGGPCIYFISRRGPYRLTSEGVIEYLGRDLQTLFGGLNLSRSIIPPFGVWHEQKRQIQWWVTTSGGSFPDRKLVLHVNHARRGERNEVRGGWALHTEGAADVFCAVMFANTLGATMSLDLKPYVGQHWVTGLPDGPVIKYDADGTTTDRGVLGTEYIARVRTGAFPPGGPGMKGGVTQTYVLASTIGARSASLDVIRDFGAETRSATVALPGPGSPVVSRALTRVESDALAADAKYVEIVFDDDVSPIIQTPWAVDALGVRVRTETQI